MFTLFPTVPEDSSAAKMPFPAFTSAEAVRLSSSAYFPATEDPSMMVTDVTLRLIDAQSEMPGDFFKRSISYKFQPPDHNP